MEAMQVTSKRVDRCWTTYTLISYFAVPRSILEAIRALPFVDQQYAGAMFNDVMLFVDFNVRGAGS